MPFIPLILFPLLYVIVGTALCTGIAALYNFLANKYGGIEFTLEKKKNT
jgi:hypothetical protein